MTFVLEAGQSNALGYLNDGPAPYTPTWRVQIWTDTDGDGRGDHFVIMVPGWNTGTPTNPTAWGPEVEIANDWLATHASGTLYIGKDVKGETPLAQADGPDWSPHSQGELFDQTSADVTRMMAAIGVTKVDALFWMQGEQDATRPDWAADYADNLREFLAAARADWMHDPNGFVSLGRISDSAALPWNAEVRDAQWLVDYEDPNTVSFKTIGFAMQPDTIHYAPEGQLELGDAFFSSWLAL